MGGRRAGARGPMNPLRVFTARSTGIGMATGVLVAIAFGQLLGVAWGLAVLNGLAAGALALALSIDELRGGWLDTTHDRRRTGIRALAYAVSPLSLCLVYNRVMTVSVHEAKTHLSRLLQQIAAGEDVIITRSGQPVARLVPIEETRPVFGVDEGRFVVPDDFDDPLDEELLGAFEGRTR